jgi:cyanophycinase
VAATQPLPPRFLIGGGRDEAALQPLYEQFLEACPAANPTIGCLVIDEGDGAEVFDRFAGSLGNAGRCEPVPLLVPLGSTWQPAPLTDLDALLVCAGLTPAYQESVAGAADAIRRWMTDGGRPYAGFSAGAAIAPVDALVGGFQLAGRTVCPEDAAEDLDAVTVRPGLALAPFTVDVHCAQWGTLSRLVAAVEAGLVPHGVALDEHTMLALRGDEVMVHGTGQAWVVTRDDGTARVQMRGDGQGVDAAINRPGVRG